MVLGSKGIAYILIFEWCGTILFAKWFHWFVNDVPWFLDGFLIMFRCFFPVMCYFSKAIAKAKLTVLKSWVTFQWWGCAWGDDTETLLHFFSSFKVFFPGPTPFGGLITTTSCWASHYSMNSLSIALRTEYEEIIPWKWWLQYREIHREYPPWN